MQMKVLAAWTGEAEMAMGEVKGLKEYFSSGVHRNCCQNVKEREKPRTQQLQRGGQTAVLVGKDTASHSFRGSPGVGANSTTHDTQVQVAC